MAEIDINFPHRRFNPLIGEYVLVSPQRNNRPWQGQVEKVLDTIFPSYDPGCYLCPGNSRKSGQINASYEHTFVFTNDFSALQPETPTVSSTDGILQFEEVRGTARVLCYSPKHDLSMARMTPNEIRYVIDEWANQTNELGRIYHWVQIFENKGAMMGSSMPHPHGQIWAMDALPNEPNKEDLNQKAYYNKNGNPLLVDYVEKELQVKDRIVVQNGDWLAVVPFWAVWPYETLLLPKKNVRRLPDLNSRERDSLSEILKKLLIRYDNLFETSFPYSMGWHGAPFKECDQSHWQLHAHFYPPLLRSATIKKFMVGFEMLGEAQRDLSPEQAAELLRSLPEMHYKERLAG